MILQGIDRYRVPEPLFEGIRVILSHLGEQYSPAYIQGISGAAFRVGGICPCAPTCTSAMQPAELIRLLGYEAEQVPFDGEGDPQGRKLITRIKDEIRRGRPVLVWHAFTNCEWDVVCGFDENTRQFQGRGSYLGLDEYATADETRAASCDTCPGVIFIGDKTATFDAAKVERAALQEAVSHARSRKNMVKLDGGEWVFLDGLAAYKRWAEDFRNPEKLRGPGDAYCYGVYRATHRAAAGFLREIAKKHPKAENRLLEAAQFFTTEAGILDRGEAYLWWNSPEGPDTARNLAASELLADACHQFAQGIKEIETALIAL